jgi:putative peptidoglycan lipid II flippase
VIGAHRSRGPGRAGASRGAGGPPDGTAGGATRLQKATIWMAAGTSVSRLTGLLRVIALAYALGATHLADAYNLANTTPNMIYDIVLGGVLSATFIPVFVDRLATRTEREAWRAISAVVTAAVVVLVVMTVVFWVVAPEVVSAYTVLDHATRTAAATLGREKAAATTLLRWFVPQVALYGFIALMTALLNTRRRFVAPMWVPIANNVVCIAVLWWFHEIAPKFPTLSRVHVSSDDLLLLGLGTTAGVFLQALLLVPNLRGTRLGLLRWKWDPGHEAVRTVVRLGGWTFGFVLANQAALYVVLALALSVHGPDPVSSYTYAYTFMQMPYAVVAVSVMSAVTPDLSERWATGDIAGFRRRLAGGLRATLAVIVPAAVGMLVLARPAVALLLGHGQTTVGGTGVTGSALAMFSLGLPGFCTYLYVVRVLQSMQRTNVAFWLYLVENGMNVVLAVALVHPLGVRGLALALSVAYTAAAVVGVVVLRRWLGELGTPGTWSPLGRVAIATAVMGAVVVVVSNLSGAQHGIGLLLRVCAGVVAGVVVYAFAAVVLGGRHRPMSLLVGGSNGQTPTAGAGAGLGTAWGDTRVPVNTGPRIRILPGPGAPTSAPGSHTAPPLRNPPGPRGAATEGTRRRATSTANPSESHTAPTSPVPVDHGGDAGDNADDPGERRWIGGTATSLRHRRPR